MKYTINKKEIEFRYLTKEDIDNINKQIECYETEIGDLTLDILYKHGLTVESVYYSNNKYQIDIDVIDDNSEQSLINLEIGDTTKEIADDTAKEIYTYLICKLINEEVKKL